MDIILQSIGAVCYLLNKIFLAIAEGNVNQKWRIWGWLVYISGVPAWVIIMLEQHNWMAAAIQIGGIPTMVLGLYISLKGYNEIIRPLSQVAHKLIYILTVAGAIRSIYHFGGITAITQVLEIVIIIGFLSGSYLLAKKDKRGWLWFAVMNAGMSTLMLLQNKYILAGQQIISLAIVITGLIRSRSTVKS